MLETYSQSECITFNIRLNLKRTMTSIIITVFNEFIINVLQTSRS